MNLKIDCQKTTEKLVKFIKDGVKKAGFKQVVIGFSGGIDSAVSLTLAVKALAKENVFAVVLPYSKENKKDVEDIFLITNLLKIPLQNVVQINIQSMVDSFLKTIKDADQIRKGNIIARTRMILLYDLAKKHQALVCGTENKSEHVLGYYTRFGDEASDLEPIKGYYKTQIRQLARFLNIPEKIINKPPSAGLWQGQTDEKELGFSYQEADPILALYFEKKHSWDKITQAGFETELLEKVKAWIEKNEFKSKVPLLPEA